MGRRSRATAARRTKAPAGASSSPASASPAAPKKTGIAELRELSVRLIREGEPDEAIGAVEALLKLIERLTDENNRQALRLAQLIKERYGRQSEKLDPKQLSLFLESVSQEDKPAAEVEAEAKGVADETREELEALREQKKAERPPRVRTGRNELPAHLPREPIRLKVTTEQRTCGGCGCEKSGIGVERSEVLEYVPAHLKVLVYEREKVACRSCGEGVAVAKVADKVIEGGRPGPGLLAHLVVGKYVEHLPIHRLSQRFKHLGVPLPASTLGSWLKAAVDLLEPLYKSLCHKALRSHVLGADDTGVRVLDRDHPAGVRKGFFWSYVGYDGEGKARYAVFDYTPDRKGEHPRAFLDERRGLLQCDGYQGLDRLFTGPAPPCVNVGCHMHFRRYFKKALDAGDLRAAVPLEMIQRLYAVEALATERSATAAERLSLRQERSAKLIHQLERWMAEHQPKVEPKSPLGQALTYGVNQWASLKVFLTDGSIPIDNGEVERRIRPLALGRKNWLFVGTDDWGQRAAVLFSLMASCSLADLSPEPWLRDVLTRLSQGWPQSRLDELLPDRWRELVAREAGAVESAAA